MRQSLTFGPAWRGSDRILSLLSGGLILAATALPTPQALAQTAG